MLIDTAQPAYLTGTRVAKPIDSPMGTLRPEIRALPYVVQMPADWETADKIRRAPNGIMQLQLSQSGGISADETMSCQTERNGTKK
jgi:hypothetical protein